MRPGERETAPAASGEAYTLTGDPEADRLLAAIWEQTNRMEEVGQSLAETRGRGEAADGHVQVEVLASGELAALRLDPRALRLGSESLAEAILKASGEAAEDAAEQTGELLNALLEEPFQS
ncbi:YbaB/EbfC family nucleoid-associated protein [Streptosporangium sp. NPDC023615]|uniref:YbaB/EbfC family nucleoid-associated protein n=1 Tax=Streptosporangium sp. NPDC023615 TaxID=3154794 RepID=UPI00341D10BD